jgi:hypothetical protein
MRRRAASAAGVITALAIAAPIAAPVAEASAATPAFALPALPAAPAFAPVPLSFVGPAVGAVGVAIGPTVIGSVFNGGTTVCVSAVFAACSTNASP